jgi:endoglucanase
MIDQHLLKTLVETWGPPGYEHVIRAKIQEIVSALADESFPIAIHTDRSGGLVCHIAGQPGSKKVMIAAHMDEIGFFIHHIDQDGFGRFSMNGYLFSLSLWGNRVLFEDGTVGVIGLDDPYKTTKVPTVNDFYIDFMGAPHQAGDVGAMERSFVAQGDHLIAKSMDDRVSCALAIQAIQQIKALGTPPANDLYFVFTTQEEVGIRGARVSATAINPDYALAIDVTSAGDQPKNEKTNVVIGGGAAIKVRDAGHIVPPMLKNLMIRRAQENHIPYQLEILDMGTTDAAAIQVSASGVPSMALSIPCRYVHTVSELVSQKDLEACLRLIVAVVSQPIE